MVKHYYKEIFVTTDHSRFCLDLWSVGLSSCCVGLGFCHWKGMLIK